MNTSPVRKVQVGLNRGDGALTSLLVVAAILAVSTVNESSFPLHLLAVVSAVVCSVSAALIYSARLRRLQ